MARLVGWWAFFVAGILSLASCTYFVFRLTLTTIGAVLLLTALIITVLCGKDVDFDVTDAALLLSGFVFNVLIVSPTVLYPAVHSGDFVTARPHADLVITVFACLVPVLLAWIVFLVGRFRDRAALVVLVVLLGIGQTILALLSLFVNSQAVANVNRWA